MDMDNSRSRPAGTVPGTDYRSPAPFHAAVSRRRFLQAGGVLAGAAAVGAGASQLVGLTGRSRAEAATGTIADLKHVVILMQENRSFDHYFGTLRGVRGFSDKQVLKYQSGTTIFEQPDKKRTDLGYLLPFHMDSTKVDAQNAGDLDHSWAGDHSARNSGLWNNWVAAKTEQTMGYFTRNDLPFNYALADAFTICDGYHQSILGPTSPNRMYFWTGTSQRLDVEPAGLHRRVHQRHHLPRAAAERGHLLAGVHQPRGGRRQRERRLGRRLRRQPAVVLPAVPDLGEGDHGGGAAARRPGRGAAVAAERGDAARPEPRQPRARPVHLRLRRGHDSPGLLDRRAVRVLRAPVGEPELRRALRADGPRGADGQPGAVGDAPRCSSPTTSTTATSTTCCPGSPETTVTNEFIGGLPIGFGPRVPMIICSPWTRGGYVDSNTYDHTSMLRFLETWTGVPAPNITAWRRSVTGDLTAAFDFASPDFSVPALPDTVRADHAVRRGEVLPRRRTARRGRAGDAGPGAGHPPAPAEPASCRTPTSP